MKKIKIEEHDGYYFSYDESDASVPVTIYSNWKKTGKTPAVIDESYSRPLKSADDRSSLYVTIATQGKKERLYIDTLVARYLLDNPNNYQKVIHLDGNIYNCHPSNLKWVSDSEFRSHNLKMNILMGRSKQFEVTYKNGKKKVITGFLEFLKENDLKESALYNLRKGIISEYKNIISFEEIPITSKYAKKEPQNIDVSDCDIVELQDWPGYYIVYKKNDSNVKVRIFSKWKRDKDQMILSENFTREISQHLHKTGYYQLNMKLPGKKKIIQKVHRLVAKQLVKNPNPEEFDTVDHIDWNKLNNHPSNLQWMTLSENSGRKGPNCNNQKNYEIYYNNGEKEVIRNLNKFCRERGYSDTALHLMKSKRQECHKNIVKIIKLQTQEVI